MKQEKAPLLLAGILAPGQLRVLLLGLFFLAGFLLLAGKLYLVQIQSGDEHRKKISSQSIRRIRIPARRGKIFSADLRLLAGNRAENNLVFYPEEMRLGRRSKSVRYMLDAAEAIAAAIGRKNPLIEETVNRHLNTRPGLPITVFKQLSPRETARALECARAFRGIDIEPGETRIYPCGRLAAHLIGSTRPESRENAADRRDFFYYVPDLVGRDGIEREFDRLPDSAIDPRAVPGSPAAPLGLLGLPGYSLVQVDHLGYIRQSLIEKIEPLHGNNVILTIDSRAQEIAESLLVGKRGAFVLLDAANGDILAAASNPAYDLGEFTPILRREYYQSLLNNPERPLINRAFQGVYTPGSILKPLVALALLNAGVKPESTLFCDGGISVGNATIRCASWRSGGHGEVNLISALEKSCNPYMIAHGLKTGLGRIATVLASAGIGRKTGVELPEGSGTFPSDAAKRRLYRTGWNAYDTALLSIGQGMVTVTPLQAALFTAALANGGDVWQPHLVRQVVDPYGNVVRERKPLRRSRLATTPEHLETVRQGMYNVVNSPHGSGREAALPGFDLYGKTGSAEVGPRSDRRLTTWFICFVTRNGKTYAAAIMIEEGRSGGKSCAPLAAEFFSRYFQPAPEPPEKKANPAE